MESSSSVK
jgi:predicted GTPase